MDLEKREPRKYFHSRSSFDCLSRFLVFHLGYLLSFATASICIALAALYHQSEAVLIVMSCSNILYGLGPITLALCSRKAPLTILHKKIAEVTSLIIHFVTMGAAVEYFNFTRKHSPVPDNNLHNTLLIVIDCLLLITLFTNGLVLGFWKADGKSFYNHDDEKIEHYGKSSEKFVPLKNSSQTLTPSLDLFQTINQNNNMKPWNLNDLPGTASSDEISFPSVLKHKLSSRHTSSGQLTSRKSSSSKPSHLSNGSNIKNSLMLRLRSSKSKRSNSVKRQNRQVGGKTNNIEDRYVTRLSTIPDLSRSILNFINSSSAEVQTNTAMGSRNDKVASQITDTSKIILQSADCQPVSNQSTPALELERNAIERINSALLPPCLNVIEPHVAHKVNNSESNAIKASSINSRNSLNSEIMMSPDVLETNDLGDIPNIPALHDEYVSSFRSQFGQSADLPQVVTLDMWEKNKSSILRRAESLQENILLPAFQFTTSKPGNGMSEEVQVKNDFSYPGKHNHSMTDDSLHTENDDCDTIGVVEDYFNDISENDEEEESQLMQEGLKHDQSSSFIMERASKDLIRTSTRHSPTKSIISIISGNVAPGPQRVQTIRNGYVTGSSDMRSLSQANHFFSNSTSTMNNSPTKSSPTKSQRLKKIGKKLSISNISDSMINHSANLEASNEQGGMQRPSHERGRSIDFSYVHTLQSNHSPSKSGSGSVFKDRRHSLAAENSFRTASGLFSLQNGNLRSGYDPEDFLNTPFNKNASEHHISGSSSSKRSADSSDCSATSYPEVVMSEYDRERWNTLLSLNIIHSEEVDSKA